MLIIHEFPISYVGCELLGIEVWILMKAMKYGLDSPLISIMQGEIYLCDNDAIVTCVVVMLVTRIPHP